MALATQPSLLTQLSGFRELSNSQKLGLILGVAAIIALLVAGWLWYRTPTYQVLFSNLSEKDGGAVIAALQQMNVPYKTEGTSTILVPMDQVYETRLKLASQGLPKGSVVGFELMEGQKLGVSQFVEQVNYQRALEGELTRSIQSLAAVQGARVHLAIPRPSVFLRDQQKPSASVLLHLGGGRRLDPAQVSGIVHLVASSVPELTPENVTVIDQNGNLLTGPETALRKAGLDASQIEYLRQVEETYARRIEAILAPIVGPENVRAQVTAELDFSQTEQTAETYKPNPTPQEAAVRSLQSRESVGAATGPAGVPGALSNQPPGAASAPITGPAAAAGQAPGATVPTQKEQTVNYEVDRTIRHTKLPAGSVKRLSAAVVVNYRKTTTRDGKVSVTPMSAAELTQINNLVKEAMGFNAQRGDSVNVVNAAFNLPVPEKVETPFYQNPWVQSAGLGLLKFLAIATIIWVVVFVVLRPILRELARVPAPVLPQEAPAAGAAPEAAGTYEQNLAAARELARQNPSVVANVVREWVGKEGS
ncbi:MAG: flagellar M-ring protein FliF [Burkholderiales bacterium]|nr:flagellar M-ring protein FliF [Burkholderiales bacterium]